MNDMNSSSESENIYLNSDNIYSDYGINNLNQTELDLNQPIKTQCKHYYHKKCLNEWLDRSDNFNCPTCRSEFDIIEMRNKINDINDIKEKISSEHLYKNIQINMSYNTVIYSCDICQKNIIRERYHRQNDSNDICMECAKTTSAEVLDTFELISDKYISYIDNNFNYQTDNLSLQLLNLKNNSYDASNIVLDDVSIIEPNNFNCVKFKGFSLNIKDQITVSKADILYISNTTFEKLSLLNHLLGNLSPSIKNLNIYNIEIKEMDQTKLNFDPSKYLNLEKINISFKNCRLFNTYSFDLSNHINLKTLDLDNLIVYDLISEDKLKLNKGINYLHLLNTTKRKEKFNQIDLSEYQNLGICIMGNIRIKELINLPRKLKHLQLTNSHLELIGDYPLNIKTIIIENAHLKEIGDLHHLTKLKTLVLTNCRLHKIGHLGPKLSSLDLTNNFLKTIPQIGSVLSELETAETAEIAEISNSELSELNLSNNNISKINIDFKQYISLYSLNISNNKISEIDIDSKSIEMLFLENNTISNIINLPKKLIKLNLANNKLISKLTIPKTVVELNINNNQITDINLNYLHVEKLYAKNNKLTKLELKLVLKSYYPSTFDYNLSNNKLKELFIDAESINYLNINRNTGLVMYFKNLAFMKVNKLIYASKCPIQNQIIKYKYLNEDKYIIYNQYTKVQIIN